MVEKEIIFRLKVIDEASGQLKAFKEKIDNASGSSAGTGKGNMNRSPKFGEVPGGKGGRPANPEGMISQESANMLRLLGQYRLAWLSTLPKEPKEGGAMGGLMVKGAAALVILQAIGDIVKQILAVLEQASPLLQAEMKILRVAIDMAIRPLGDAVANFLRPISRAMLRGEGFAYSQMEKEGKNPATDLGSFYKYFGAGTIGSMAGWDVLGEDREKAVAFGDALGAAGQALIYSNPIWGSLFALSEAMKYAGITITDIYEIWKSMWGFGKKKGETDDEAKNRNLTKFGASLGFVAQNFMDFVGVIESSGNTFSGARIGETAVTLTNAMNIMADGVEKVDVQAFVNAAVTMSSCLIAIEKPMVNMTSLLVALNPEISTMRDIVVPLSSSLNLFNSALEPIPGTLSLINGFTLPDIPDFTWPEMPRFEWPNLPDFSWPTLPEFKWPEIKMPWDIGSEQKSTTTTTNAVTNALNIGTVVMNGVDKADQGIDYLYNLATGR
jgi:hypothetical protein